MAGGRMNFHFLYQQGEGEIGVATWWTGLLGLALAGVLVWAPSAFLPDLVQPGRETTTGGIVILILEACYGVVAALGFLLVAISLYNLSAKRFRDRGRPPALAGILPLGSLLGGMQHWLVLHLPDIVPLWTARAVDVALFAAVIWNVVELGFLPSRTARR